MTTSSYASLYHMCYRFYLGHNGSLNFSEILDIYFLLNNDSVFFFFSF